MNSPKQKKTWIGLKRGFVVDPKHRHRLKGEIVWTYMFMLDQTNWDTGTIEEWLDESAAELMEMPVRTLRDHRRKLADMDYITCEQRQYNQRIIIHKWVNPRNYSGEVMHVPETQGDIPMSPSVGDEGQGDIQGYIQGSSQHVTPTMDSPDHQITSREGDAPASPPPPVSAETNELGISLLPVATKIKPVSRYQQLSGSKRQTQPAVQTPSSHPWIQAFREIRGQYPKKDVWDSIAAYAGDDPPDANKLRRVNAAWCNKLTGVRNPYNFKGIIDWYRDGIPSYAVTQKAQNGAKRNGRNQHSPQGNYREATAAERSNFARLREQQRASKL